MATMNANDFESITVLKDASAAAVYGARGGLGVIVITTKRGKAGTTNFSYRSQYGFTNPPE
jgi:TonB-dependent SusC/RagA subfamily outer membrane receptor